MVFFTEREAARGLAAPELFLIAARTARRAAFTIGVLASNISVIVVGVFRCGIGQLLKL